MQLEKRSLISFQAHVRERLLSVQPEGDAAGALDGPGEFGRRPLHADVRRLVLRGPPLRDDHLRKLSVSGSQQQSGH